MADQRGRRAISLASAVALAALMALLPGGSAADSESEAELAKRSQNPIADLISVPLQNDTSFQTGPRDRTQSVTQLQPVIPIGLGEGWNLITRTIFPIVSQPSFERGQERHTGIGDTTFSAFLSAKEALGGWLTWGAGPVVNLPTASDERLGADRWGAGVTGVGLTIQGPVVAGVLVNNVWSLEGEDSSRFLLQYFLNYNLPDGWFLSSSPVITADWEAENDAWLVPVGGGFGKVHRIGRLPVSFTFQAFYNAEKPRFAADWSTRTQVKLLFPR